MGKKQHLKNLNSDLEEEIRNVVRDEFKKSTKTDMNQLLEKLDKIISEKIKVHLTLVAEFIKQKITE